MNVNYDLLSKYSKDELIELIEIYSKNWLAHDGVWFQSIEQKLGMYEAMEHDINAWKRFTVIEAKKIKEFLTLPERAGLEGLAKALSLRLYANINKHDIKIEGNTMTYKVVNCRVQSARARKGLELHPCKSVGIHEYGLFAKVIDERISCTCASCYPDICDNSCACKWICTIDE